MQKKKSIIKITALILCIIFISSAILTSCGSKYTDFMTMKYRNKNYKLSVNVMNYFLSVYKTMFLYQNGAQEDNSALWTQTYDGSKTVGDIMKEQIITSVKKMLAAQALFDYNKLSLTKEQTNAIDRAIRDLVNSDKYGKSSARLNDTLAKYSINMEILKEIRILEKKYSVLREYLFTGKNPAEKLTDEDLYAAFKETYADYVRVKHILVSTMSTKKDAEGKTVELTEEELAEKKSYAEEIYEQVKNGKPIEEFYSVTDDASGTQANPDGYLFPRGQMLPEFETAGFEMMEGEVRLVKTDAGYHIMQKFPVEELFESYRTDSQTVATAQETRFVELIWPFMQEITMNNQEVKKINFTTIPTFFDDTDILPTE